MVLSAAQHLGYQQSNDLHKIDLTINQTIASAVNVELFNYLFSCTDVYNASISTYHPVQVSATPITVAVNSAVANTFSLSYFYGGLDSFVSAANPAVPAGNTRGFVFFDELGALTYKPGYVNGALDPGSLTIQSKQTNYKHAFRTLGHAAIYLRNIKVTVLPTFLPQLQNDFKFISQNITSTSGSNNQGASTYSNEYQQNPAIVTMPINQPIDPNSGLTYPVLAGAVGAPNTISLTMFFVPMTKML